MPYPIETLSANALQRFRQLATPVERLRIQIAGPEVEKLDPPQLVHPTDDMMQISEGLHGLIIGQTVVNGRPDGYPIDSDELYCVSGTLYAMGMCLTEYSDYSLLDHWYLTPKNLKFNGCTMDLGGLTAFMKHLHGSFVDSLQFVETTVAYSVTLTKLFNFFPNAMEFLLRYHIDLNWAQVLYDSTRRFRVLGIRPTVQQLDNLYRADFLAFFKAQGPNFKFIMFFNEFVVHDYELEPSLKRLLGSNFERVSGIQQPPFIEIKGYSNSWQYRPRYKVDRTVEISHQASRPARTHCLVRRCVAAVVDTCCCLQ